jgi:cytoskeleton protein RodZ
VTNPVTETETQNKNKSGIGLILRDAREALGLTVDDISLAMKVSNSMVRAMEDERFERLGAPVYVRGFLRSYAKRVSIETQINAAIDSAGLNDEAVLVSSNVRRPHAGHGERWMLAASYLVGTAIVISAVVLVLQADKLFPATRTAQNTPVAPKGMVDLPLTPPVVAENTAGATSAVDALGVPPMAPVPVASPVMENPPQVIAAAMTPLPQVATTPYAFQITAKDTSWVKVVDGSGTELYADNLQNGRNRDFNGSGTFDVLIGNAAGAEVRIAGQAVDVSAFVRGNVAKFRLVEQDGRLQATAIPR